MKPVVWKRAQFKPGEKNKHKCWMCRCHLTYEIATVDHIKPKSLVGMDRPGNYRLACFRCNQARGNRPLTKDQKRALYGRTKSAGPPTDPQTRIRNDRENALVGGGGIC